jgi:hypothetical protein
MALDLSPLNLDKDATEIWVSKGDSLLGTDPKVYNRKNYNHNIFHIHNPNGVELRIFFSNYIAESSPMSHFQAVEVEPDVGVLVPFENSRRVVLFGKVGYFYVEQTTAGKVWIHVLSGERDQK